MRFCADTNSTTAVEFAMIGAVLFLFLFAIFVLGIYQFWQLTLDDAVRNASRQVQLGNVTSGADFVTQVCAEFGYATSHCGAATMQYSVQGASTFGAITPATLSSTGTLSPNNQFSNVNPSTVKKVTNAQTGLSTYVLSPNYLLVQVAYLAPFKIPLIPPGMATENGTPALYSAIAVVMEIQ
jgi:Flp pilus assembly protein TadG